VIEFEAELLCIEINGAAYICHLIFGSPHNPEMILSSLVA
jgi:hypothetical protein